MANMNTQKKLSKHQKEVIKKSFKARRWEVKFKKNEIHFFKNGVIKKTMAVEDAMKLLFS